MKITKKPYKSFESSQFYNWEKSGPCGVLEFMNQDTTTPHTPKSPEGTQKHFRNTLKSRENWEEIWECLEC